MKNKKGFTLAELMISISIITILIVAGFVYFTDVLRKSRDNRRKSDLEQIRSALEVYRLDTANKTYPANLQILITGNYITNSRIITDPLPSQYIYAYQSAPNTTYAVGAYIEGGSSDCTTLLICSKTGVKFCNYCVTNP